MTITPENHCPSHHRSFAVGKSTVLTLALEAQLLTLVDGACASWCSDFQALDYISSAGLRLIRERAKGSSKSKGA